MLLYKTYYVVIPGAVFSNHSSLGDIVWAWVVHTGIRLAVISMTHVNYDDVISFFRGNTTDTRHLSARPVPYLYLQIVHNMAIVITH